MTKKKINKRKGLFHINIAGGGGGLIEINENLKEVVRPGDFYIILTEGS